MSKHKNYNRNSVTYDENAKLGLEENDIMDCEKEEAIEIFENETGPQEKEEVIETFENEPLPEKIGVVYDCSKLRLRSTPSFDGEVLDELPEGTILKIVGNVPEWYIVIAPDDKRGYCLAQFISIKN